MFGNFRNRESFGALKQVVTAVVLIFPGLLHFWLLCQFSKYESKPQNKKNNPTDFQNDFLEVSQWFE